MKCDEIQGDNAGLGIRPDGDNTGDDRSSGGLRRCAGKLEEFRQTMTLLDEWQTPEPSPYFDMRLQARLREKRWPSRR